LVNWHWLGLTWPRAVQLGKNFKSNFQGFTGIVWPHQCPHSLYGSYEQSFQTLLDKSVVMCIDDILIYSKNREEPAYYLRMVLQNLKEHLALWKIKEVWILVRKGGILGSCGYKGRNSSWPPEDESNHEMVKANNVTEIKSFLGLVDYYRRFVKDFSKIASPLRNLLKKVIIFEWIEKC